MEIQNYSIGEIVKSESNEKHTLFMNTGDSSGYKMT